ncbi:MAG: hypothetical protein P1U83_12445 [Roseovarius sp.]|nr:hypothetical protein [Roseovarius sp.]
MNKEELATSAAVDLSVAIAKHREWWFVKLFAPGIVLGCVSYYSFSAPVWAAFGFGFVAVLVEYARQQIMLYLLRSERASIFRKHPEIFRDVEEQFEELKSDKKFWQTLT